MKTVSIRGLILSCLLLLCAFHSARVSHGQAFTEDFSIWPVDLKINGTVIACNGKEIDKTIPRIFEQKGGGDKGKFVVVWFDGGHDGAPFKRLIDREDGVTQFGNTADTPIQTSPVKDSLKEATGVLLLSSQPLNPKAAKIVDQIKPVLTKVVDGGGVVCCVGPVLTHLGKYHYQSIGGMSLLSSDLNLVPDAILLSNYVDDKDRRSLISAIAAKPNCVGIGMSASTGLVLSGRKIRVYGANKATFALMANERQPLRIQHLAQATGRRASPYTSVIDLTAWRRDAIERSLSVFPPAAPPVPKVENGTLFIVGGGGMPRGLMRELVDAAGGKEAKLVYVPCAEQDRVNSNPSILKAWKNMGVASASVIHTKDRNRANSDEEFLKPLAEATGIWFGGGRQWNFADSYYGTQAHKLMKDVLQRGGAIGGSSAGASIQGDYLARANPVANFDIMAPGYERGLGFLTGVAIDQHFSQRGRHKDMTQLANRYPQLLGIGIDEGTAIVVQKSVAKVTGKGKVFFYDRRNPVVPGADDFTALSSGQSFDLDARKLIVEEAAAPDAVEDNPSGS